MDEREIERIVKAAVDQAMEAVDEREKMYRTLITKHEHLLYGNGKPGLTTIVDRLERAINDIHTLGRKVIETLVIAGVIGLIILVVQANILKP